MTPEEVSVCVDELMASPKLRAKIQKTYEQVDRAYRESLRTGQTVQLEPIFAGAPYPVDPVGEYLKTSAALRQAGFGPGPRKFPDNLIAAAVEGALSDGAAPGEVSRDLQRLGAAPPDPDAPFVGPVSFEEFYAVREAYQKPFKELDKAASDAFFGPPLLSTTFEYAKPIDQERWDRDRETIREHLESQPPEGEPKMVVGKNVMDELKAYLNAGVEVDVPYCYERMKPWVDQLAAALSKLCPGGCRISQKPTQHPSILFVTPSGSKKPFAVLYREEITEEMLREMLRERVAACAESDRPETWRDRPPLL